MSIENNFIKKFELKNIHRYLVKEEYTGEEYLFNMEEFAEYASDNKHEYTLLHVSHKKPVITDRILLELICLLNEHGIYNTGLKNPLGLESTDYASLRLEILADCIHYSDVLKVEVQELFNEVKEKD